MAKPESRSGGTGSGSASETHFPCDGQDECAPTFVLFGRVEVHSVHGLHVLSQRTWIRVAFRASRRFAHIRLLQNIKKKFNLHFLEDRQEWNPHPFLSTK